MTSLICCNRKFSVSGKVPVFVALVVMIGIAQFSSVASAEQYAGYLLAHFIGESSRGEQIYFASSTDGLNWTDLNKSLPTLISAVGEEGVRDPSLIRSNDGTKFWLLATDLRIASGKGWDVAQYSGSTNLVFWESEDLVHWSAPWMVDVAGSIDDAGCAWAPEAIWDDENQNYVVYWATMSSVDGVEKQRLYYATTTDFKTFSDPVLYIERDGDQDVIDTQIIKVDGGTYQYYRASRDDDGNDDNDITIEGCNSIIGTWTEIGGIYNSGLVDSGVEGPILYKFNNESKWGLWVDQYATGRGYLPLTSTNLADINAYSVVNSSDYSLGLNLKRHGGILSLTAEELKAITEFWSDDTIVRIQTYDRTKYVRHYSFNAQVDSYIHIIADSQWRIVEGLADSSDGCVSIMSVNYPSYYLRNEDGNLHVDQCDDTTEFAASATFKKVAGLANAKACSFATYSDPDRYIIQSDGDLVIDSVSTDTDKENATFFALAIVPTIGDTVESYNNPGYFMHSDGIGSQASITEDANDLYSGMWHIVPGLADSSWVSFESVEYPGYYLRHYSYRLQLNAYEDSNTFRQDATFYMTDGLADSSAVSFYSYNFPARYLRHSDGLLRIDVVDSGSDAALKEDATFYVAVNPPAVPTSVTAVSGIGTVSVDWDYNFETDFDSYDVYRSEVSGGPYTLLDNIAVSEYVDCSVENGTKYYYSVVSKDTSGHISENSEEDTALPPDLNDDDKIDLEDFAEVAQTWLSGYTSSDLAVIADNWLVY